VQADGAQVTVPLREGLPDSGYTVTYRVISADSHPVSGGFVFTVGEGAAPGATVDELLEGTAAGPVTRTALSIARGVQYSAAALAIGIVVFLLWCWRGAPAAAAGAFTRRLRALLAAAASAGVASAFAMLVLQGANARGVSVWEALDADTLSDVLGTRFGTAAGAGLIAWLVVLALLALRRHPLWAAAPLGVVVVVPGFSGHAAADALLAVLTAVHVLAISAWIGGIAVLVLALRAATQRLAPDERSALLRRVVGRFSALAGVAVAVVLATGIAQSLRGINEPSQLVDTAYGRAVAIKIVLFAVLVGFGVFQRRRVLPRLSETGALLRRVLRMELAVAIVVLGVTAALAGYQPADTVAVGPFSSSATVGPARLELTVDPARVGADEMHLYFFERSSGAQWDVPKEVALKAALPDEGIEPIDLEARKAGPGHYVVTSAPFGLAGDWTLEIAALVTEFDELRTEMTIPIEE
jgi:copper transport protein